MNFNSKRFLDIVLAITFAPVIVPLFLVLTFAKLVVDGRPLFYNSVRIGRNREPFVVYKFRTMVDNPEFIKNEISKLNSKGFEAIPLSSVIYTDMGRIYERFQFVELPQLFNVLRGDMSFIGYRPLPIGHLNILEKTISSSLVLERSKFTPGITGFAQLSSKFDLDSEKRLQIEILEGELFNEKNFLTISLVYLLLIILTLVYILTRRNDLAIYFRDRMLFKAN